MSKLLVMGCKPCYKDIKKITDEFKTKYRINLNCINMNKTDNNIFILNCHLYHYFIKTNTKLDKIIDFYKKEFPDLNIEKLKLLYKTIVENKEFNNILVKCSQFFPTKKVVQFLNKINYRFSLQPRCGMCCILNLVSNEIKPHIIGFTIKGNNFDSYYKKDKKTSACHEDPQKEIKLIRLLHNKGLIDASLCLLENGKMVQDDHIKPTEEILSLLKKHNIS